MTNWNPYFAKVNKRISPQYIPEWTSISPVAQEGIQRIQISSDTGEIIVDYYSGSTEHIPATLNFAHQLITVIQNLHSINANTQKINDYIKMMLAPYRVNRLSVPVEDNEDMNTDYDMSARGLKELARRVVGVNSTGYVSERDAARFMMTEAARALAKYEKFPENDPCEDGDVISFFRVFPQRPDEQWHYAGVRVEGKYYLTGGKSDPQGYTWSQLVDWMRDFVTTVTVMKYSHTVVGEYTPDRVGEASDSAFNDEEDVLGADAFPSKSVTGEVIDK